MNKFFRYLLLFKILFWGCMVFGFAAPTANYVKDGLDPNNPITVSSHTILTANWEFTFDLGRSAANYEYKVSTVSTGIIPIIPLTSVGLSTYVVTGELDLAHDTTYYIAVKATDDNAVTGEGISTGVLIDLTPPSMVHIYDGQGDGLTASSDTTRLEANWFAKDSQSGISKYYYAISSHTVDSSPYVVGWTDVGTSTYVASIGLSLVNHTTYYFLVKAVNGAGATSPIDTDPFIYHSEGVLIDTDAPSSGTVIDGLSSQQVSYTSSTVGLGAHWEAIDEHSGIGHYEYKIIYSSSVPITVVDWTNVGLSTYVLRTGLTLEQNTTYYFWVKAFNQAGVDAVFTSTGQLVDATAPVIDYVNDGDGDDISYSYDNTVLSANWEAYDPESGISEYYYAISSHTSGAPYVVDWTDVGYPTSTYITRASLSLEDGATYYVFIKAINKAGGVTIDNTSGVLIDSERPVVTEVNNEGVYEAEYKYYFSNSSDTIKADWKATKNVFDISKYYYAISSHTLGYPYVVEWTDVGTSTYVIKTGLSLNEGATYYVFVQAENIAGKKSDIKTSNGIGIYITGPEAAISLDETEPLVSGEFNVTLELTTLLSVEDTPSLQYILPGSSSTIDVELTGSNKVWTGRGFIGSDVSSGTLVFTYTGEDIIGNTSTVISTGSEYSVDLVVPVDEDKTVQNEDGSAVVASAGSFDVPVTINIENDDVSNVKIAAANQNITNSDTRDFADNYGVFRKFEVQDGSGNIISQFNKNIEIRLPYNDSNSDRIVDGTNISVESLWLFYLDETNNEWVAVSDVWIDFSNHTVNAYVSHFSIYSILPVPASGTIDYMKCYPNPCYMDVLGYVKIGNLPNETSNIKIYIYNINGRLVRELDDTNVVKDLNEGNYITWDARNESGSKVATGVYIVLVKDSGAIKKEKIAILW